MRRSGREVGLAFASAALWLAACSSDPGGEVSDAGTDASLPVLFDSEGGADSAGATDTGGSGVDVGLTCPGSPGCPCKLNDDCDFPVCLHEGDQRRCARACVEDCPEGYDCRSLPGGDVIFACIPRWTRLCQPCAENADCQGLFKQARCVDRGEAGAFCGVGCDLDSQCPDGYGCKTINDVNGLPSKQCVPLASDDTLRACTCNAYGVEGAAETVCRTSLVVDDKELTCAGKAICTVVDKAPECVAAQPAKEVCDGADNDCDGDTDETACDDGEPCTIDSCDPGDGSSGCSHDAKASGAPCDADASVCTDSDSCQAGKCTAGAPLVCDDKNPCTKDACLPATGCTQTDFDGLPCDDENPCTVGDVCKAGGCTAGAPKVCTSTQPCVLAKCDLTQGGKCQFTNKPEGAACDDGDACSTADGCTGGSCIGKKLSCDDDNGCTTDSCDPKQGCVNAANTLPCDDGDACTTPDVCKAKACVPGKPKVCDDGNPCTTDTCDKGCVHKTVDDGKACGANKACKSGVCVLKDLPKSCAAIRAKDPKAKDGLYTVDPDDGGPQPAVKVFCDMQRGGWTLVGNYFDTAADDMPGDSAYVVSGWQRTGPGKWAKGASVVDRKGAASANAAVSPAWVAALGASAGQVHLKICLVHKNGSDSVCRSTFAGDLSLVAFIGGNPKLAPWQSDKLTYTFARLAGLTGGKDSYTNIVGGKYAIPREPGEPGEFGFHGAGLVDKDEDPQCLGDGGPWHGAGCGISYRPHRSAYDELSTASCCLVGGGHSVDTSYGFRLYVGPSPTLGSLNKPGASCAAILKAGASLGSGVYWLDLTGQGAQAKAVPCEMEASGGGWTRLTATVAKSLGGGVSREFLLSRGVRWYRSPKTQQLWSWDKGAQLTGVWEWFNGQKFGSLNCLGSSELPGIGLGCSAGAAKTAKILPQSPSKPNDGTLRVCQPFPNAFGGKDCEPDVRVWVR